MPGIDFNRLRHEITMEQVLDLLGFECIRRRADQWYGYCPLHEFEAKHRRAFSVNVRERCYYCHSGRVGSRRLRTSLVEGLARFSAHSSQLSQQAHFSLLLHVQVHEEKAQTDFGRVWHTTRSSGA